MYIGKVAELTGATPRAIRLYESQGLIPPPLRQGRYRVYSDTEVKAIALIKRAQEAGVYPWPMARSALHTNDAVRFTHRILHSTRHTDTPPSTLQRSQPFTHNRRIARRTRDEGRQMSVTKHSAAALRQMKSVIPIPMLTAYTTPIARALEHAGVPVLLVGDTVGMVEMGFDSTRQVTMDHMQYHIGAVRRGAPNTHIVGDMPYNSDSDPDIALQSAQRLIDAGADSVKLEGPKCEVIGHLVENGIDVVGHTGLTPQTAANFKQVGRDEQDAERILDEALRIATAGAFMIVLEHIPDALAETITRSTPVPTIGIGAGSSCDGQVLVINDAIGMGDRWPPFSRQYAYVGKTIVEAAETYVSQVRDGTY